MHATERVGPQVRGGEANACLTVRVCVPVFSVCGCAERVLDVPLAPACAYLCSGCMCLALRVACAYVRAFVCMYVWVCVRLCVRFLYVRARVYAFTCEGLCTL